MLFLALQKTGPDRACHAGCQNGRPRSLELLFQDFWSGILSPSSRFYSCYLRALGTQKFYWTSGIPHTIKISRLWLANIFLEQGCTRYRKRKLTTIHLYQFQMQGKCFWFHAHPPFSLMIGILGFMAWRYGTPSDNGISSVDIEYAPASRRQYRLQLRKKRIQSSYV